MPDNPFQDPIALGSPQGQLSPGPSVPGSSGAPKPKNKGGRKPVQVEVDEYLQKNGLATVPVGSTPQPGVVPGGNPDPMVPSQPFDEMGTRAGIAGLLGGADAVAQWHFERTALQIIEDEKKAEAFGKGAAMPPPTKEIIVNSAVEVCRKHNVNIGPEAGLLGGLGQWAIQLRGLFSDLRALAEAKAKLNGGGKTGVGP